MPKQRRRKPSILNRAQYRQLASEHSLQVRVLSYLAQYAAPDVFGFAIPNAGRRSYRAAAALKAEGMMRGIADTCIMLPEGRTGWLELKTIKGRQSDEQQGFQQRCWRLGHEYALVRTLDEALAVLKKWGALR